MKSEIYGLWQLPNQYWIPCGLNIWQKLWWRFVPGVVINVRWPNGPIVKEFADQYKTNEQLMSADPNEHYRPWLEQYVGRQGWDWNWGMARCDVEDNRLTIKIRRQHENCATIMAMRWA